MPGTLAALAAGAAGPAAAVPLVAVLPPAGVGAAAVDGGICCVAAAEGVGGVGGVGGGTAPPGPRAVLKTAIPGCSGPAMGSGFGAFTTAGFFAFIGLAAEAARGALAAAFDWAIADPAVTAPATAIA